MRILFLCGAYSQSIEPNLNNNCKDVGLSVQANNFQSAVIDGLKKNNVLFSVLSYPFLPIYPFRYKKMFSPECDFIYNGAKIGFSKSYCLLPIINSFSIIKSVSKEVEEWANRYKGEDLVILTYTQSWFFIQPLKKIKKKYPNIRICAIVTDLLSISRRYREGMLKRAQAYIDGFLDERCITTIDKFVLLTKPMEEEIPYAIGRNIIVEGICDLPDYKKTDKRRERVILYTGVLRSYVGIRDLVDAFIATTDKSFRLMICGDGPDASYIKEKALLDNRIEFLGRLPREEVLKLQRQATALINPRKGSHYVTRYSFPSKTMEYMTSGTPMIGYRLEGMPDEYYEHIYVIPDENKESLTDIINTVLTKDPIELENKALSAYEFIKSNKTSERQVKRILNFLEHIN